MPELRDRQNMIERQAETWRPPLFGPSNPARDRAIARLRRFRDLQAGSIWRDLAELFRRCRGVSRVSIRGTEDVPSSERTA